MKGGEGRGGGRRGEEGGRVGREGGGGLLSFHSPPTTYIVVCTHVYTYLSRSIGPCAGETDRVFDRDRNSDGITSSC